MTITVAQVKPSRVPYAEAARVLLRDSVLDAMRDELLVKDWSAITLSDVARTAGVSRQTIYNEFGSRHGLAQAYALRLADRLVDEIDGAINSHVGDIHGAFMAGFRDFFAASASAAAQMSHAGESAPTANAPALLSGLRISRRDTSKPNACA